jgi:acetyl-CoA carboxylase carboxyl transferase subunit alpha
MLEFAYYSVISPEGCASILWKDAQKVAEAATQLRLSAPELKELAAIDDIIPEPAGGAHCDKVAATQNVDGVIWKNLEELLKLSPTELREQRYARFRRLGAFNTTP